MIFSNLKERPLLLLRIGSTKRETIGKRVRKVSKCVETGKNDWQMSRND